MHEFFRSRDQWRPFAHILTRAVFKVLGKSYFEFKLLRIDTIQFKLMRIAYNYIG